MSVINVAVATVCIRCLADGTAAVHQIHWRRHSRSLQHIVRLPAFDNV